MTFDEDALRAAVDLIGRTGAESFECYIPNPDEGDEPPYVYTATAVYRGTRLMEESSVGPVEATEALARRLLEGGKCTHCGGLVTLSDDGVYVVPGTRMMDGSVLPDDPDELRKMGTCRYRRVGAKWERGCGTFTSQAKPNRAERRAHKRRRRAG